MKKSKYSIFICSGCGTYVVEANDRIYTYLGNMFYYEHSSCNEVGYKYNFNTLEELELLFVLYYPEQHRENLKFIIDTIIEYERSLYTNEV